MSLKRKHTVLCVLVLSNALYLYLGGLIFSAIEKKPKVQPKTTNDVVEILDALKSSSYGQRVLPDDFNSKDLVEKLSEEDLSKINIGLESMTKKKKAAAKLRWSFSNSLFFSTTVVTTIGYGNLAPTTLGGRMFCIVYALIGIPLTLMLLAVVANVIVFKLNNACAWVVSRIRMKYFKDYEFEAASKEISAPVWLALPIIFVFLALLSSLYCALEGWDFGTSLYYIFITFTTIGFGDIVPSSQAMTLLFQSIWINTMLLYVGLSIVSITINLCASGVARQMKKTGKYIKILEYFQENEEHNQNKNTTDDSTAGSSRRNRDPQHFEMEKMDDEKKTRENDHLLQAQK